MSHEDDDAVIILSSIGRNRLDNLPEVTGGPTREERRKKIEAILEQANKEVDKVLKKNPNL